MSKLGKKLIDAARESVALAPFYGAQTVDVSFDAGVSCSHWGMHALPERPVVRFGNKARWTMHPMSTPRVFIDGGPVG
jgi:hypothetical protein